MKNYPLYEAYPYQDFKEVIYRIGEIYHSDIAFSFKKDGTVIEKTYGQFKQDVICLSEWLLQNGYTKKQIALVGETSYEWFLAYFAIELSKNVCVPIDKELPDGDILNIIEDSKSEAVFYSAVYDSVFKDYDIVTFPFNETLENNIVSLLKEGTVLYQNGSRLTDDIVIDKRETSVLMYTSGTTGKAKGIMLCQNNFCEAAVAEITMLEIGKKALSVLPCHHSFEFSHGILALLMAGVNICINDSLRYLSENLNLFKPELLNVVPQYLGLFYKQIMMWAKKTGFDIENKIKESNELLQKGVDNRAGIFKEIHALFGGNIKLIICGGAPLSAYMMRFFREIGLLVLNGYGISECAPLVSVNRNYYYKDGSVGIPISCCSIKLKKIAQDNSGEIWVKGPNVMNGYYKNEAATKEVMDEEGYFNTGDIGHLEGDFLFITGRAKNIIVLDNGKNIYPEELEDDIVKIPAVLEAVVYEKSTPRGAILSVQIYPDPNFKTEESVKDVIARGLNELNKRLPVFKQVRDFSLRDTEFEKTTTKKIKRSSVKGV